jgi:hypothetical protein
MEMKLICLMPVRNEDWCLGLTARAVLMWCDELLVLNHASTDGTAAICMQLFGEYAGRFQYRTEQDPVWSEMDHRQRLLVWARERGATHIVMVDADEILTGNLIGQVRTLIERIPKTQMFTMQLPWICIRNSYNFQIISGMWAEQNVSMCFEDRFQAAGWAPQPDGYQFHHRHPAGIPHHPYRPVNPFARKSAGGLMHLQFLNHTRLIAKQALYQMQEVLRWPGRTPVANIAAMYGRTVAESAQANVAPTPANWWAPYEQWMKYLDQENKTPWQLVECRRLLQEHGRARFAGLNLFNIACNP